MFDLSPEKLVVVLVLALVILGPDRLPQVARSLARARAEVRRFTAGFEPQTLEALKNPRRALFDAINQADPTEPDRSDEPRP